MGLFSKSSTIKSLWTTLMLAGVLTGCAPDYLSKRSHRQFYADAKTELVQNQIRQLRKLDTLAFRHGAGVYIHPIIAKRNGTGVYGYNRHSSHFGRVHFFFYKNDSVIPVSRNNEDSLRTAVRQFLAENGFSTRKVNRAMRNLKEAYDILSTDSF